MDIKVEKYYQQQIPVDMTLLVRNLLTKIPQEHLVGLGSIILVDHLTHKYSRWSEGLYWHKKKHEPAKIEIALGAIFKGTPKIVFYLPFVPKFMLANVLFHEIGHHYQQRIHNVTRKNEDIFAEKYKKQMLKQAFSYWRLLLLPLLPFAYMLSRKLKR